MFKLQFFRVCEPERLYVRDSDAAVDTTELPAAAAAALRWLQGPSNQMALAHTVLHPALQRLIETARLDIGCVSYPHLSFQYTTDDTSE